MTVSEIKRFIFDPYKRRCCNTSYCGNKDAYCPKYNCLLLWKMNRLSDRQWENIIKECEREGCLYDEQFIVELAWKKLKDCPQ